MIRFLMTSAAAVVLLAAPVAASAATATRHAPMKSTHHVTKASSKTGKHMAKPMSRDGGAAAVDSLNDQALQRAKSGDSTPPQ